MCARAQAFERKTLRDYWVMLIALGVVIAGLCVYLVQFPRPMMRLAHATGLGVFAYIAVRWARNGPPEKMRSAGYPNTCVSFLRDGLVKRRKALLEMRWLYVFLLPGALASWSIGGPAKIARWLGMEQPWLLRFYESPGPLLLIHDSAGRDLVRNRKGSSRHPARHRQSWRLACMDRVGLIVVASYNRRDLNAENN